MPWDECLLEQQRLAVTAAVGAARTAAYRKLWEGSGVVTADISIGNWQDLPLLSKDALIESAQTNPPFGDRLAVSGQEIAHIFVAPGPLYMPFTKADMEHVAGSFLKAMQSCGLNSQDLVDQTTMYNWVIAATAIDRSLQMIGCAVVPGGIGQSEMHLDVIRNLNVNAIVAFPTFLEHLLELAAQDGQPLPLQKAVVMGELSHPDTKKKIHEEYGLEVREFYGVADVGAVAWECQAGDGMHLRDDLLVEFLTPEGVQVAAPSPDQPAELVVTDFHRQAMPIIRLRTGDMINELITDTCSCGNTSPRFRRIVGRAGEITKVKGMFVVPRQVKDVFQRLGIERRFRLVVSRENGGRDTLMLEISGEPVQDIQGLLAKVEAALRLRVSHRFVDELPEFGPLLVDHRLTEEPK